MSLKTVSTILAAAAVLAGCVSVNLAPAGSYAVGKTSTVTLDRAWSDISPIMVARPKNVFLLSIDGPMLNRLYLTEGLKDGDYVVRPARREATTPVYSRTMTVTEQVEFVADSVTALDYERVETARLRPVVVSGERAVRFDISAQTKEGLDIKGQGQVLKRGDQLFVAIYLAPAEHYYDETLASAEAAMSSISF